MKGIKEKRERKGGKKIKINKTLKIKIFFKHLKNILCVYFFDFSITL
jgi:hypothetical protein